MMRFDSSRKTKPKISVKETLVVHFRLSFVDHQ